MRWVLALKLQPERPPLLSSPKVGLIPTNYRQEFITVLVRRDPPILNYVPSERFFPVGHHFRRWPRFGSVVTQPSRSYTQPALSNGLLKRVNDISNLT